MAQGGRSGEADVSIENAETVGDFQSIFVRNIEANRFLQDQITSLQSSAGTRDQQHNMEMAQIRIELRQAQAGIQAASNAGGNGGNKMDLVDVKSMAPAKFAGLKADSFKTWAKKLKAYTNAKVTGFREALDLAGKSKTVVDIGTLQS